jgi:two-component system sensor histidine kinase VicK
MDQTGQLPNNHYQFLKGGGKMGELIRSLNWAETGLGLPENWPAALKQTVSMMLTSTFPILICWGENYLQLYNDAFRPINGETKHPRAMGNSARETYAEIWDTIGPMFKNVMNGESFGFPNFMVPLNRNGYMEDCYFDFSYSPIRDEGGSNRGILVICIETTERKRAEFENQTLTDELSAINEEMEASNEELRTANEELDLAQQNLRSTFLQLEESETALRLAVEAANFGTWYIHSVTRAFITDARLRELFGYYPNEDITIEDALAQITDEYRGYVATALENAIYKGGDYDVTYPVIGFHDLKLRWLRAIGNLKADPSGEFSAFTGVVMDVSELKKDEQRKNDFIGMVSHELKTPLTSLNAYLQMLQGKARNSDETFTLNALDQSVKQVKRMTTMINGFLNVSRLEAGKIHMDKQLFDMAELVKETETETIAMNPSHYIIFHPVEPTFVMADRDKIGQVINNLISNAVKYANAGSVIQVACITVDGAAQVSVSDQGIGIKPEDIDQLFERYYRVENNSHISGFGIGLYLSAEIITRHDGKIWAESTLGEGSTFYFTLPVTS